jgi:cytochrome b subunit of formate dehydrogenase
MNKLSDDTLNKYIDGELDFASVQFVNDVLASSVDDKKRYEALLLIHNELKKIKEEHVSETFTNKVMQKLYSRKKAYRDQRKFLFVTLSIFISIIMIVIGLVIYSGLAQSGESKASQSYSEYIMQTIDSVTSAITQIFSPKGMSIFGSIISLGILVSGYFFFENLKTSKQKIHKPR